MEGRGKVGGEMQDVQFAKLLVRGQGKMQPFEVETQAWNPISEWEVTLGQGSVLAGYMTMGQASADGARRCRSLAWTSATCRWAANCWKMRWCAWR
jgi:hypothetical protein